MKWLSETWHGVKGRLGRAVIVVLAIALLPLAIAAPAYAGALTSTSFTIMDPRTGIMGNRYDWGFKTATTATLSRVTMGVPTKTTGTSRALLLNGIAGNYASTPDSASNSITGDIDLRVKASVPDWYSGTTRRFISKRTGTTSGSYSLELNASNNLELALSADGTTWNYPQKAIPAGWTANTPYWLRATYSTSSTTTTLYWSSDGTNWTSLGTSNAASIATLNDPTDVVAIGSYSDGTSVLTGRVYYADVRNGIQGTTSASTCTGTAVSNCFDPNNDTIAGTSWTSASSLAETWTVNRSGTTNLQADIGSDLSVMNISGLPSGGSAQIREIELLAVYQLPTPTSISSNTTISLGLAGFTNTYTANSYSSAITTYDNSATPVSKDSATAAAVTISGATNSTAAGGTTTYGTPTNATTIPVRPWGLTANGTDVYVTDIYSSTVLKLDTTSGNATTFAGTGVTNSATNGVAPTSSALWKPEGVAVDGSGNVFISDYGNQSVRKVSAGTLTTYVNTSGASGYNGDGTASTATLNNQRGVVTDAAGNLYIADMSNYRIRKVDTSGNITTIAGTGTSGFSGDGGAATSAKLNNPTDVAVNSVGDIYIADYGNNRIRRIDHVTSNISTVAGTASSGYNGDNQAATSATLFSPKGVAIDASDNLYISDSSNHRIRKVDTGGTITTVAGTGTASFSGDGGAATSATIWNPNQVRLDSSGNLYIADQGNNRVRKVNTSGNISTVMGTSASPSWQGDGATASTSGRVWDPFGMTSTSNGDIYIADSQNNLIRKVDQWGIITTVAGQGPNYFTLTGDGGAATSASLNGPLGVAVASDGTMYIADNGNNRIRKVSGGTISSFATVTGPQRVAINPSTGDIYVTTSQCTLLKYTTAAVMTVVAGVANTCSFTGDGGAASSATLGSNPKDIVFDANGNTYVADDGNGRVRMIDAAGNIKTVAGGGGSTANNIAATSRLFTSIRGLAIDSAGYLYLNNRTSILRFNVGGPVMVINTNVNSPGGGLTVSQGSIFTSDYNTQTIKKVADLFPLTPNVNADSISVPMNGSRSWPIMSNDWSQDKEMDPTTLSITTQPAHGTVSLTVPTSEASTLQATYMPTASYTGSDSFVYQACDTTRVQCATATVTITVGSNQVTTVAGGVTEGLATNVGFNVVRSVRFKNYLFITENNFNTIRRFDIYSRQVVVVAGMGGSTFLGSSGPASAALLNGPAEVVLAPDGTLYFADSNANRVRRIATDGSISTVAGTGALGYTGNGAAATSATLDTPYGLAFDSYGGIYVTTIYELRLFTVGGNITAVVGDGVLGSTGDGGAAGSARVNNLRSVNVAPTGNIYLADRNNCVIRKVSGGIITTVAGQIGTCSFSGDGGAATSATLNQPRSAQVSPSGTIYVTDGNNNRVRTFTDGGNINTVVGTGTSSSTGDGGAATSATVITPLGVAFGTSNDYYVTESSKVRYVNGGGNISTVVGNGSSTYSGDGISSLNAQILSSASGAGEAGVGLAVDASGNVYFAGSHPRVRKFTNATALVSTIAGNGTSSFTSSTVGNYLGQLAFDNGGLLVFADYTNNAIRRLNADTSMTTLAGTGSAGNSGDGGAATSATLNKPRGVGYDAAGNLYIADTGNNTVRKVTTGGIISTIAGTGAAGYSGDGGPGTSAQLNYPSQLAVTPDGNVYIADRLNNRIRMVDARGVITTVVGTGAATSTGDNGLAAAATINTPNSVAVDADGNVYIADTGGNLIRKVDAATGVITSVVGTGTGSGFTDNTTYLTAKVASPRAVTVANGNLYYFDDNINRIRMASGIAPTTTNNLTSASWSVMPPATGHANLRDRFVVTPAVTSTSSKLTFTMPTSVAATPTVVENYGLTGSVSASLSGTTLTVSFPSQTLTAGVPVAISIEGFTNGGANGSYTSNVTLYDSAGTTATGWAHSNVVTITSSGAPTSSDAGYGSIWLQSTSISGSTSTASVAVSPGGATQTTSMTITSSGNMNSNSLVIGATTLTRSVTPLSTFSGVTADVSSGVATGSFGGETWGSSMSASTGAVQGGAATVGSYVGNTSSPQTFVTGASATTTFTLGLGAKTDWLLPAGVYRSTITYRLTPGS